MLHLSLTLLGAPQVRVGGAPGCAELHWRKHIALLARLALAPGMRVARPALQDLLWPGPDDAHSRRSLNEAVRRLRNLLGVDRFRNGRDCIELSPDLLEVDVASPSRRDGLHGEFLEGVIIPDSPAFEDWVTRERHRLSMLDAARVLRDAAARLEGGDLPDAARLAGAVIERHPLHIQANLLAMRALALSGRRDEALELHRALQRALAEVSEELPREVEALARRLQASHAEAQPAPRKAVPLVGRERERAIIARAIGDAARGTAVLVLITGDAGSGRTSLLNLAANAGGLDGAVLRTRCLPDDEATPWSLLRALLRAGLAGLPGAPAVAPDVLALLAWFSPALAARVAPRAPADEGDVVDALAGLLAALTDEQPVFIVVDDARYADGQSLDAIHGTLVALPTRALGVIMALDVPSTDTPLQLLHLTAALGRGIAGCRVDLGPLSPGELRDLVVELAPWCADEPSRDRLVRRLQKETGGELLMSVTLLESLQELASMRSEMLCWPVPQHTLESPLPVGVPVVLRMAMLGRIARLDEADRRLLGVAAWLGPRIDTAILAEVAGAPAVDAALARLERARLITLDDEGYAFPAPLYAELYASECLTRGERRRLALTRESVTSRVG